MTVFSPLAEAGPAPAATDAGYVFDNDSPHAQEQHRCLAAAYDPVTTERLAATGVTDGWHCLEVGAGGGSVALWLARRVAPSGRVVATDLKPGHVPTAPGLEAVRHDISHDPLPEGDFDLIHARLVLLHLPDRRMVLRRLLRALRPGGWLQIDEFDVGYGPSLLMPDPEARRLYETFLRAKARAMAEAGADLEWGREAAGAMRAAGFAEVDPRPHVELWHSGSPGVRLLAHHTHQLRERLLSAGMTEEQLASVRRLMAHPEFRACSCVVYTVHGRRPLPDAGQQRAHDRPGAGHGREEPA